MQGANNAMVFFCQVPYRDSHGVLHTVRTQERLFGSLCPTGTPKFLLCLSGCMGIGNGHPVLLPRQAYMGPSQVTITMANSLSDLIRVFHALPNFIFTTSLRSVWCSSHFACEESMSWKGYLLILWCLRALTGGPSLCFSPVIQGYHRPRHYIATQGKCPPIPQSCPCPSLEERKGLLPAKKSHGRRAGEPPGVSGSIHLFGKERGDKFSSRQRDMNKR